MLGTKNVSQSKSKIKSEKTTVAKAAKSHHIKSYLEVARADDRKKEVLARKHVKTIERTVKKKCISKNSFKKLTRLLKQR